MKLKSEGQGKVIEIRRDMLDLFKNAVNLNPSQRGRAVHMLNVGAKSRKLPERKNKDDFRAPQYELAQYSTPSLTGNYSYLSGEKRKLTEKPLVKPTYIQLRAHEGFQTPSTQNQSLSKNQPQYV
jgi:hypothetical protein